MRTPLFLSLLPLFSCALLAQRYDPLHPPNTFRNADNPYYWKNHPPYEGYWQQDVHYRIKARLDEVHDHADGSVTLTYWNNSPDTLREVFFHLYQNASEAGSYLEKLERSQGGDAWDTTVRRGTDVLSLQVDGQDAAREIDNTIMRVKLTKPLAPGERSVV